ncbi:restriction endonuclease [Corallococcus sp. M7]
MPSELRHILVKVPDDWTNTEKGNFFEALVGELIRSMRFRVAQQLRVTGMEIDLLAKGIDEPRTILVECKAYQDALSADTITKLLGNVQIRHADAGWLFSTSELGKDGAGMWEEIQQDERNKRLFVWYGPEKIIEILLHQGAIVRPRIELPPVTRLEVGAWTLVLTPSGRFWIAQLLQGGVPKFYTPFNAMDGSPLSKKEAQECAAVSGLPGSLHFYPSASGASPSISSPGVSATSMVPVARVASGDRWDDPRPAQPADFVGRADIIEDISGFLAQARTQHTSTRNFAITGPSGWGKSSLVLKLADLAAKGLIAKCSLTVIDTRSATSSGFVIESLRQSFVDAQSAGMIAERNKLHVTNASHPLDSPDLQEGLEIVGKKGGLIVLILDQFEELFVKEPLFGIFESVRSLSLEIDARRLPIVLGFSWKTDISLPQQHPAYHLWHELSDRRRAFSLKEFGKTEILKVLHRAGKATGRTLSSALKDRLVEQCQGLPWLLKKLTIHILTKISTSESQYALLERQLDIEDLFKSDLASLSKDQIGCLAYVARNSPASIAAVEEAYSAQTANQLIHARLLIRSGMNYAVYWDIFRDYLTQKRVPEIPWARTFQASPASAVRILGAVARVGVGAVAQIAATAGTKEGPCANVLSDLVALQLVDRMATDSYRLSTHVNHSTNAAIANHVERQLRRHIAYQKSILSMEKGQLFTVDDWMGIFRAVQPPSMRWSEKTLKYYAESLRRWLIFAGLLEQRMGGFARPDGIGGQKGLVGVGGRRSGRFLGASTPTALLGVLRRVATAQNGISADRLEKEGLRNAVSDALTLGLVKRSKEGVICPHERLSGERDLARTVKQIVLQQATVQYIAAAVSAGHIDIMQLGEGLRSSLRATWTPASVKRYTTGILGFYKWAAGKVPPSGNRQLL